MSSSAANTRTRRTAARIAAQNADLRGQTERMYAFRFLLYLVHDTDRRPAQPAAWTSNRRRRVELAATAALVRVTDRVQLDPAVRDGDEPVPAPIDLAAERRRRRRAVGRLREISR